MNSNYDLEFGDVITVPTLNLTLYNADGSWKNKLNYRAKGKQTFLVLVLGAVSTKDAGSDPSWSLEEAWRGLRELGWTPGVELDDIVKEAIATRVGALTAAIRAVIAEGHADFCPQGWDSARECTCHLRLLEPAIDEPGLEEPSDTAADTAPPPADVASEMPPSQTRESLYPEGDYRGYHYRVYYMEPMGRRAISGYRWGWTVKKDTGSGFLEPVANSGRGAKSPEAAERAAKKRIDSLAAEALAEYAETWRV